MYSNIICSQYDGSSWSVPQAVYGGLGEIDGASLAYDPDSNTGIYAFAMSPENNPAVSGDQIYIMKYDGTNWGSPIQVTHNNVFNANPKVTYINGKPMLVWWSGGQIDYCDDLDTLAIQVADASPSMSQDFTLANNGNTLAVVGAGQSDSGQDLYCLPYDVASGLWGGETRLTASSGAGALNRAPSAAFAGSSDLVTVFDSDELTTQTVSGQVYQAVGDTDLYSADLQVAHGLAIPAGGLSVQQGNVVPGGTATVCAQVNNTGLFAESNIEVDYYDGNPANGGQQIGSATIAGPLAPGDSATAQFTWTVPAGNATHDVYVVASDANATSEAVYLPVVQPDLSLQLSSQPAGEGQYAITASVSNTSGINISGATLTLSYLNQTTGNPMAITTTPVPISLQAGQSTEIPVSWQSTSDAVYDGEILVTGEIDPPSGVQFYSGARITDGLTIQTPTLAITGFSPTYGETNVAPSSTFELDFNDLITPGAGTVSLVSGSGGQVGITTNVTGNALTITPDAPLAYDTGYTLTVPKNAVTGQSDGSLASDFVSSFTTAGQIPSLLVNSLVGVPVSGTLTLPFSGDIQQGANFGSIGIQGAGSQTTSVTENMLKIGYSSLAYNTNYTVQIPAGALEDTQGDPLPAQVFTFQTVAGSAPVGPSVPSAVGGGKGQTVLVPVVQTEAATGITSNSAVLNGDITSGGASAVTGYGFRWGTDPGSLTNTLQAGTDNHSGSFSATLTGLTAGTTVFLPGLRQ